MSSIEKNIPNIPSKAEMIAALEQRHGKTVQEKFSRATVAVCGLGGLGSNIAISLARAGVGRLILIDYDKVDITNLHRQQYKVTQIGQPKANALSDNLAEIAPYIAIRQHNVKIDPTNAISLLCDADIVCEAFDNAENKAMLVNTVLEVMPDKYLVSASGMAGLGSPNEIKTRRVSSHFYLCGDGTSEVSECESLVAPRVALCAASQALTVLRILSGNYEV